MAKRRISNPNLIEVPSVPTEPPAKLPLIAFSGGLDSMYSLTATLATSSADILIVTSSCLGKVKLEAEARARKKILAYITKMVKRKLWKHNIRNTYTINVEPPTHIYLNSGLRQPQLWLQAAAGVIRPDEHSKFVLSYVKGDCAVPFLSDIEAIWKSTNALLMVGSNKEHVPIDFPIVVASKQNLIAMLTSTQNAPLLDMCWSCELPVKKGTKITPCGHCMPCQTSLMAKIGYALDCNDVDPFELLDWVKEKKAKSAKLISKILTEGETKACRKEPT